MPDLIVPIPSVPVSVREATLADVPFIDALQKAHRRQVGFMPDGQLRGKIKAGDVIVAEDGGGRRVGYCVGTDRYFKHDDVGIIYQLNVAPGEQRRFVGATLLRAMFERAAYGCKLFCCWCAQDIEANRFWAAMGFVPLAFRAGSEKTARVHIFWQKRIRAGDTTTPWWFPAKTDAGAMREDRLVLPIPPGTHWSDEMPRIAASEASSKPALDDPRDAGGRRRRAKLAPPTSDAPQRAPRHYGPPPAVIPAPQAAAATRKPKPPKKPKVKADPKLVAAARELRDRWLERVNAGEYAFEDAGKYDVSRTPTPAEASRALPAAPVTPTFKALPHAA